MYFSIAFHKESYIENDVSEDINLSYCLYRLIACTQISSQSIGKLVKVEKICEVESGI